MSRWFRANICVIMRTRSTFVLCGIFAATVLSTMNALGQATIRTDSVTVNGETIYVQTTCSSNGCHSTVTTAAQRAADQKRKLACKEHRKLFGKNLEAFPGPFGDYEVISCIEKRKFRNWITDRNYAAYLRDGEVHFTLPDEYKTYLKSQGFSSKLLPQ